MQVDHVDQLAVMLFINLLLSLFSEGQETDAYTLFSEAKQKDNIPSQEAYHVLLDMCVEYGDIEAARVTLHDMKRIGHIANQRSLVKLACTYLKAGLVTDILPFLQSLEKELDIQLQREAFVQLMQWSNKCQLRSKALSIYDAALQWDSRFQYHSDLVSEHIQAIGCIGDVDHLIAIEQELQLKRLDPKVWSALAIAYADNGLPLYAFEQIKRMIALNYVPSLECTGAMLSSCLAMKDLDTACQVVTLLDGCRQHTFGYDRYAARYYSALLQLQISAHEDVKLKLTATRQPLYQLLQPNHYYEGIKLSNQHMIPNSTIFEALFYLGIIRRDYDRAASEVLTTLIECGRTPPSSSFFHWTEKVTRLSFNQAMTTLKKTLDFIERARVSPTSGQWCQLMKILLKFGDKHSRNLGEQAAAYLGLLNGHMSKHSIKHTSDSNDVMLSILARTGSVGALLHRLRIMGDNVQVNKDTFHIVVDGLWKANEPATAKAAVFNTWGVMMKLGVGPSLETVNKLILCCGQCGDLNRAFYFFDILRKFELEPDTETFNALVKVCLILKRKDKADKVLNLMQNRRPMGPTDI
jgi:pentatricopeptide repeat protein